MQMGVKGQSLLEVIFVLPFLFIFVVVLFKLNLAIQAAINNTQYSRSQMFSLAANSTDYPRLEFRLRKGTGFISQQQDMMILGVSDPSAIQAATDSGTMDPIPQTQTLDKTGKNIIGSNDKGEQSKRNEIRIRNTAAMCTQINSPPTTGGERWPFKSTISTACQYNGQWIGDFH